MSPTERAQALIHLLYACLLRLFEEPVGLDFKDPEERS